MTLEARNPFERALHVHCSVEHAFRVWTERATTWWPPTHRLSKDPQSTITFEGKAGGRVFERATNGDEHEWGRVVSFEPPTRLVFDFYFGSNDAHPSRVTVTFAAAERCTDVLLRHEMGAMPVERWNEMVAKFANGWGASLPLFIDFTNASAKNP